jgi:hypothetical protein
MKPLKYLPTRLSASAIIETLGHLGISVPLAISASAKDSRESLGYAIRASKYQIDEKELGKAIAQSSLSIGERLRLKFALENVRLLYN